MTQRFTERSMQSSPITHRRLPARSTSEAESRENALRSAFVNASSALGYRPMAWRSTIDKAASTEARRPWKSYAEPLRAIAIDASQQDRATQDATERLIIDAVISLLHYVLEPLDPRDAAVIGYVGVSNELSEGVEAITTAKLNPTPENLATADREAGEAARSLQLYRGGLRTSRDYMRPLGASPMGAA
jgi:hypothetical protein